MIKKIKEFAVTVLAYLILGVGFFVLFLVPLFLEILLSI